MSAGGVLEFALGLETHEFLHKIGVSAFAIEGLAKAGEALHWTFEKAFGQIEKGAALYNLSKRTGENVANLFMLQKGFKASGVSADGLGTAIFMLNKSLGGVNEMGEKTDTVFQKLGLSIGDLKADGGASALVSVLEKLSKLDQTSATKAASLIFGRGVAGDIVQISRNFEEFGEAMKGARAQAEVFQKVAGLFKAIEHGLMSLKAKFDPIYLAIAARLAPALKYLIDLAKSFDIKPIADAVGAIMDVFSQAFREGKLWDLLKSGFDAAMEWVGDLIMGTLGSGDFWKGIWDTMLNAFMALSMAVAKVFFALGALISATLYHAIDVVSEKLGQTNLGKVLGLGGYKATSFDKTFQATRDMQAVEQDVASAGLGEYLGKTAAAGLKIAGSVVKSGTAGGPAQDRLRSLIQGLLGRATHGEGEGGEETAPGASVDFGKDEAEKKKKESGGGERTNASELERMGFVFNNGAATDHAATVARNTGRTCELLEKLVDGVEQITNLDLSSKRPQDPTLDHGLDLRTKLELDLPNA